MCPPINLQDIFSTYQGDRTELIPVLQDIQDKLGYLPKEAMEAVAAFLNVRPSIIFGVVSFYSQFYLTRQGEHIIKICRGTACHVKGSKEIMEAICRKLDIEPGGTTADFRFTLERVACVGSCALAPVVVVDSKVYGAMTSAKTEKVIDAVIREDAKKDGGSGE